MARKYTVREDQLVTELYRRGNKDTSISKAMAVLGFNRSVASIGNRRIGLELVEYSAGMSKADFRADDLAFKKAMLSALKAGTETAVVGVVKDRRPIVLKTYQSESDRSLCGSSSDMCAGN